MRKCLACGHVWENYPTEVWACSVCHSAPVKINNHLAFAPELAEINEGFETFFFPELFELESNNFWFRGRNNLIIWALRHYFSGAKKLLEIGCGTGFVLSGIERALPHLILSGSEIYTTGLEFAAQRVCNTELWQMDARFIPFVNEFDVICAFDVLEHIVEDTSVLAQLYEATTPQGGIILTVPQHPWLWSQVDEYSHHVRRYQAHELKRKVEAAGFKVLRMTSFVSFLLPLMLLSRLMQKHIENYDASAELKISGWLNRTLELILDIERWMIQGGLSFGVGGSLLLMARKIH